MLVESERRMSKTVMSIDTLAGWLHGTDSVDSALAKLQEKQGSLLSFAELKSREEAEAGGGGRESEAVSQLHLGCLTARVAILTTEIASARSDLANQSELNKSP